MIPNCYFNLSRRKDGKQHTDKMRENEEYMFRCLLHTIDSSYRTVTLSLLILVRV